MSESAEKDDTTKPSTRERTKRVLQFYGLFILITLAYLFLPGVIHAVWPNLEAPRGLRTEGFNASDIVAFVGALFSVVAAAWLPWTLKFKGGELQGSRLDAVGIVGTAVGLGSTLTALLLG
ncbi:MULTISPECIES: hypothetical protein [unclassified Pseudoclavibacter]|uniref:hypothetical protein n=1 Tax=unclassified Pseudoclavibacter TaxID=2615177 RepID=UPI001BAB8C17|nr:hypothetical protein [Pseudoclavibacter sp. Marseille-Q4354]MBS3180004.1 hypothetical protein [Pseudoclavibacter sp. Marseille-Q4354]